jgi:hypothetical protein
MMVFVLNAGWTQFAVSMSTSHNQALPPVPPAPIPLPSVPGIFEGPAFMGWPPGFLSHKKAGSVLADGCPGIQQGHDVGYLLPHFAGPMNALCAVNTLFSKHKIVFPVNSVELEGKPVGTNLLLFGSIICSDPISRPSGVLIPLKGTVLTNMTWGDFVEGVCRILVDIALDVLWNFFKGQKSLKMILGSKFFQSLKFLQVLDGLTFFEMVFWGGGRLVLGFIARTVGDKLFQHLLKSWLIGPLFTGLAVGKPSVGRGRYSAGKKIFTLPSQH